LSERSTRTLPDAGAGQQAATPREDKPTAPAHGSLAEQVAERVYDLLREDLRLERERMGRKHARP
jgi:hypothetical protein